MAKWVEALADWDYTGTGPNGRFMKSFPKGSVSNQPDGIADAGIAAGKLRETARPANTEEAKAAQEPGLRRIARRGAADARADEAAEKLTTG